LAPEALRNANLIKVVEKLGWKVKDKGNISTENVIVNKKIDIKKFKNGRINKILTLAALNGKVS